MPYQGAIHTGGALIVLLFVPAIEHLDYKRLGKQRIEARTIYDINTGANKDWDNPGAWANHPAVKMWKGYENTLALYHDTCLMVWEYKGYKNNMPRLNDYTFNNIIIPDWYTIDLVNSHRSNLLRKDPVFYGQYRWDVPDNLPYVWGQGKS
jgi:hypothetical protein